MYASFINTAAFQRHAQIIGLQGPLTQTYELALTEDLPNEQSVNYLL